MGVAELSRPAAASAVQPSPTTTTLPSTTSTQLLHPTRLQQSLLRSRFRSPRLPSQPRSSRSFATLPSHASHSSRSRRSLLFPQPSHVLRLQSLRSFPRQVRNLDRIRQRETERNARDGRRSETSLHQGLRRRVPSEDEGRSRS